MPYDHDSNNTETPRPSESRRRSRISAQERKARKRKLYIRRAIIVAVGLLILFLAIFLFVQLIRLIFGIGKNNDTEKNDTQKIYSLSSETTAPEGSTEAAVNTEALNFVTPDIKDDQNATGHLSEYDNSIYIYNNMALELFNGSDASAQDYAKAISDFKKNAPEYTVYNMVVPNHTEYALPRRLIEDGTVATTIQSANIKKIYESYTEDVRPINCYNILAEHLSEYTYFNTDRYWTGLGAYYGYQAFCAQTGQTATDINACTGKSISDYPGAFTAYDESLASAPDTVQYWLFPYATRAMRTPEVGAQAEQSAVYYEEASGDLAYGVFLSGDAPLFVAYNDQLQNGKKILVVKDSNSNPFVPYLTGNYQEVHVIDPGTWKGNIKSYMQDNGIDTVLFINSVMNANSSDYANSIRSVYGAAAVTQTPTEAANNNNNNGENTDENGEGNADGNGEEAYEETPEENYEENPGEAYIEEY